MFSLLLLASLGLASAAPTAPACTRANLQDATTSYLAALTSGKTSFTSLSSTSPVIYQENDVLSDITKGILSQGGIKIDFNRSIYDTTQCASYTEVVSSTGKHPYVIGTRLLLNTTDLKVVKIESNICDDGDWLFNAKGSLTYNLKESWDPIPEAKRNTREVIKAAGDAYINAWGDSTVKPPFSSQCSRLEGGSYISGGNCNLNFPPPFNVTNRRYTIDEELGAVDIFHNFPFLDKSLPRDPGTQTNNLIRVEAGQIRFIHENTVCAAKNCGR